MNKGDKRKGEGSGWSVVVFLSYNRVQAAASCLLEQTTSWWLPTFSPAASKAAACQRDSHMLGGEWEGRVQLMRENLVAAAFYTKNRGGVLAAAARSAGMESNSSDDGGNQCSVQQHDSALSATSSLGNRGCVSTFRFAAGGISLAPPTPMVCSSTALMGSVSAQLKLSNQLAIMVIGLTGGKGLNSDVQLVGAQCSLFVCLNTAPSSIRSDMTQGRRVRMSVRVVRA